MSAIWKFVLLLIGAALLALLARFLLAHFLHEPEPEEEPRVVVMAAAAELPVGLLLRAEDVDWKELRRSEVPDGAVQQDSPEADTASGVLLRNHQAAGSIILKRDVIRHDAPGFLAAALQPGMRAISVAVDNVSGNAGLIQPGDFVDMILVQQSRSGELASEERARSVVSETVVENVRIIAVGSVFRAEDKSDSSPSGRLSPVRTVTMEVTRPAAEAISVAQRLGSLVLALRSFAVSDPQVRLHEPTGSVVAWEAGEDKPAPVWAGDVSRAIAIEQAGRAAAAAPAQPDEPAPSTSSKPAVQAEQRGIVIMRGAARDTQFFSPGEHGAPAQP